MASVKWPQWIFLEFFSFTMCLAKYFTLVLPHADKSSTVIPIGVLTSQTKLHCATLCDLVPSCYSFTYSIDSLADNCRLLPSTAKSSTFTVSAAGNKHYERKVDSIYQCLQFGWYGTGPLTLTVSGGSGVWPTTYFSKSAEEGQYLQELVKLDIGPQDSTLVHA
uniref:Uncharacterized protein n=1 Tax=Magallana gigas TaxID=29159 RepID=K1R3S9_MAGGI